MTEPKTPTTYEEVLTLQVASLERVFQEVSNTLKAIVQAQHMVGTVPLHTDLMPVSPYSETMFVMPEGWNDLCGELQTQIGEPLTALFRVRLKGHGREVIEGSIQRMIWAIAEEVLNPRGPATVCIPDYDPEDRDQLY